MGDERARQEAIARSFKQLRLFGSSRPHQGNGNQNKFVVDYYPPRPPPGSGLDPLDSKELYKAAMDHRGQKGWDMFYMCHHGPMEVKTCIACGKIVDFKLRTCTTPIPTEAEMNEWHTEAMHHLGLTGIPCNPPVWSHDDTWCQYMFHCLETRS